MPNSCNVDYHDIYIKTRQQLKHMVHLNSDGHRSLELWKEKLKPAQA